MHLLEYMEGQAFGTMQFQKKLNALAMRKLYSIIKRVETVMANEDTND